MTATLLNGSFSVLAHAAASTVVINEIDCHGNDWLEVANTTTKPVNISGWILSDHAPNLAKASHRYIFPTGTVLAAKRSVAVQQSGVGNAHLPFGVPCAGGQTVYLGKPSAGALFTIVDKVLVPPIPANASYGRFPSGTGPFGFTFGTKGAANNSAMPQLVSSASIKCARGKSCSFVLKGKNVTTYSLVHAVPGVSVSASGSVKSLSAKAGSKAIQVKLVGTFGAKVVTISIVTK